MLHHRYELVNQFVIRRIFVVDVVRCCCCCCVKTFTFSRYFNFVPSHTTGKCEKPNVCGCDPTVLKLDPETCGIVQEYCRFIRFDLTHGVIIMQMMLLFCCVCVCVCVYANYHCCRSCCQPISMVKLKFSTLHVDFLSSCMPTVAFSIILTLQTKNNWESEMQMV
jgi:hypothetical protein